MFAFTSDFDRARAGYSPDHVDALVWALSDLMVEPVAGWGLIEWTRLEAEKVNAPRSNLSDASNFTVSLLAPMGSEVLVAMLKEDSLPLLSIGWQRVEMVFSRGTALPSNV